MNSAIRQVDLEAVVLREMFEYTQIASARIKPSELARRLNGVYSDVRHKMALSSLEQAKLVSAQYNSISGATYEILEAGYRSVENDEASSIPAADRLVTLKHNQISELEKPTSEIILEFERQNGFPDEPGFRERIIGQLKAGREFIRAGIFEFCLFRMSMIVGLEMIVERYKDHAIGAMASNLLTLFLKQAGLDI